MIRLILHLWSKIHSYQSDELGFVIQDAWESAKEKLSRSMDHIMVDDAEPIEYWSHYDAWCQHWSNDKVGNSGLNLVSLFMIKLTLYLWSKIHPDQSDELGFEIQDVWKSAKEELPPSTDHIAVDRCRADRNIGDIMMHDVNIKEKTKEKCQSFAFL